jgi:hypothetical protein
MRAALRTAPALEEAARWANRWYEDEWPANLTLATFRALAVGFCDIMSPRRAADLAAALFEATSFSIANRAPAVAEANKVSRIASSALTDFSAVATACSVDEATLVIAQINASTSAEAKASYREDPSGYAGAYAHCWAHANQERWSEVITDATALEAGGTPATLILAPIWANPAPDWPTRAWNSLKRELLARSAEHWDVWTDWYEARLRGEPGNEEEEIARILEVTEEEWEAGPAVANKKIKDIVARFRAQPTPVAIATATNTATAATMKSATTAPLFISHASQADGARAHALVAALEVAGQPCWIAPRDIAAGADWNGAILAAIETCGGVVLLVSPASVASPFVKAEIQHAFEHKKRVVPVRLAEAQPSLLDLRLKTVQHIEADGDFSLVVRAIISL